MKKILLTAALALIVAGVGCAKHVDLDTLPIGTTVDVTRQDGGVVRGVLTTRDAKTLTITTGSTSRFVSRDQIVGMQLADDMPAALPTTATFREYALPQGTRLAVQLNSPVGSDMSRAQDPIEATLSTAVLVGGTEVLPAGSLVKGMVASAQPSGKVKGRGTLELVFESVSVAGRDGQYLIAARVDFLAPSGKNKDIARVGIGAAGGAIIGALFGGGKGAAIGAGVGAGAGTAVVLTTRGPQIRLGRGAALSLRLDQAVDVRVPISRW